MGICYDQYVRLLLRSLTPCLGICWQLSSRLSSPPPAPPLGWLTAPYIGTGRSFKSCKAQLVWGLPSLATKKASPLSLSPSLALSSISGSAFKVCPFSPESLVTYIINLPSLGVFVASSVLTLKPNFGRVGPWSCL